MPAADTQGELLFHDKELLFRFARMSRKFQHVFLKFVRETMARERLAELYLAVPWVEEHRFVLRNIHVFSLDPLNGDLEFHLLPMPEEK